MPRFVILRHELEGEVHWDLMLDDDQAAGHSDDDRSLLTWSLSENPLAAHGADTVIPARRLADHRRLYLDYEGPISGNRGTVTRIEQGEFQWLDEHRTSAELTGSRRKWQTTWLAEQSAIHWERLDG
jgi:hypothetical protein